MRVKVYPGFAQGQIMVPPSKSLLHRSIICACLANGKSIIKNVVYSDDIKATINAFKTLGIQINKIENALEINGNNNLSIFGDEIIDCQESGSTLRFLLPILTNKKGIYFTGKESLLNRPLNVYDDVFKTSDITFERREKLLFLKNELKPGNYEVLGNVSSQFISGLLLTLPLKDGDSTITITGDLESKKYVDMTIDVMSKFGINITIKDNVYFIKGNQKYKPTEYKVESDFSQLAFFAVAGIINGDVKIVNSANESLQPDVEIINIIKKMGGKVFKEKHTLRFVKSNTRGIDIDVSQHPDIAPIISILSALSEGSSNILNAKRLRIKETDRLSAITQILTLLGIKCFSYEDKYNILGSDKFSANSFESYNDHRMVMSIAIAALRADGPLVINGAEAVNKSYPHFFEDLESLGINVEYL
ncbi:MAG: 3-phosphoshikimate 1-carboxyvinyltransferase [Candidatus Izemoplasmatales bacterium]|nr:3-phosphoshikimate 1-carboxyvinyltransferase [Candidatus Izemoplasmatales bacterium]